MLALPLNLHPPYSSLPSKTSTFTWVYSALAGWTVPSLIPQQLSPPPHTCTIIQDYEITAGCLEKLTYHYFHNSETCIPQDFSRFWSNFLQFLEYCSQFSNFKSVINYQGSAVTDKTKTKMFKNFFPKSQSLCIFRLVIRLVIMVVIFSEHHWGYFIISGENAPCSLGEDRVGEGWETS